MRSLQLSTMKRYKKSLLKPLQMLLLSVEHKSMTRLSLLPNNNNHNHNSNRHNNNSIYNKNLMAAFIKFLLIHLLIITQTLTLTKAEQTNAIQQQQQQQEQHLNNNPLSMLMRLQHVAHLPNASDVTHVAASTTSDIKLQRFETTDVENVAAVSAAGAVVASAASAIAPDNAFANGDNDHDHDDNDDVYANDAHEYDATTVALMGNVTHSCLRHCVEEETVFVNDYGVKCLLGDNRTECYRSRCFKGCELWWNALKEFEPCQEACSSTQFNPFDLPCISACEQSQRRYWHLQRLRALHWVIGVQPQLLHPDDDSPVLNSLTLKWPISLDVLPAQYLASRPFNIQYQYVRLPPGSSKDKRQRQQQQQQQYDQPTEEDVKIAKQWWNLADYNCNENFECDIIDGLMPYTSYRFRFELPFGENYEDVMYTPASPVYTTPAMGGPISQPIIKQSLAIDETHIAVFWKPGRFTNGPLEGYSIAIEQKDADFKIEKILSSSSSSYIASGLSPSTIYNVRISMVNGEGKGPAVSLNITTKDNIKTYLKLDDFNSLVMAGEYSLILKSLDPLIESKTLFKSEEILTDFDVHQYAKRAFVVDAKGHIFTFLIDNPLDVSPLKLIEAPEDFVPSKLSIDWLNQKLYVAGKTSASIGAWKVFSFTLNGSSVANVYDNLPHALDSIQVDPLNGWLFAKTIEGNLLKINLTTSSPASLSRINPSYNTTDHFVNDYSRYLLKTYNSKLHAIQELSYNGLYSKDLAELSISPLFQGHILSFILLQDQILLASNGTHLLRQNFFANDMDLMAIRDIEFCWKIKPLMHNFLSRVLQPLPQPLAEPKNLQATLSDTKAIINWNPPEQVLDYQSAASWHLWEYELEILDVSSNSAFNIRSIRSTFFHVERLQANNLYKIKVRALFSGQGHVRGSNHLEPSQWSHELTTRTWPMGHHRLLWSSLKGIYESDELAEEIEFKGLEFDSIRNFEQVNSSLYYISHPDKTLKCFNLMNPEITCGFRASSVQSLAYDWRGGKLYWSDLHRNCLIRSDLKGEQKELLPIFNTRSIKLDSAKGFIYYATDLSLLRRHLSGSLELGQELEYHHANGNAESIRGFALDFLGNQIFWFVQYQEENTKLYRCDMDEGKSGPPEMVLELPRNMEVAMDSFQFIPEIDGFIWLSRHRRSAIIVRKEQLNQWSEIQTPHAMKVSAVKLRSELIPFADPTVIPDPVDKESVVITEGNWDDFNIKWSPVNNLKNLSLFYRVLITSFDPLSTNQNSQLLSFEVPQPLVRITEFKMPFHNINVTITPFTLWSAGSSTFLQLRTPSAAPKQPRNLRVFVEQLQEPLQDEANITALVRWDSPDNISTEKGLFYKVYCWLMDELHSAKDIDDLGSKSHEVRFFNLKREHSYTFQVQAFSLSRSQGGEKTSLLTHFINPEVQSSPKLIFSTTDYIGEFDMDLNTSKVWVHTSSEVEHLVVMPGEQRLIWVNENVELMSYQPGSPSLKLARMRAEVLAMAVDWMQRKVYWAELSGDIEHAVDLYMLDLNQYEGKVMMGLKLFSLNRGKLLKDLLVLPYSQYLMWLEYDMGSRNATLQGRNLNDLSELKFKNMPTLIAMFDGCRQSEMETVNLMDYKGKLFAYELQRQLMTSMKIPLHPWDQLKGLERDAGYIYALTNHSVKAYNRRKHNLEYSLHLPEVRLIKSLNFQEYPKRKCLIMENIKPAAGNEESEEDEDHEGDKDMKNIFVNNKSSTSLTIRLPLENPLDSSCKIKIPGLKYHMIVRDDNGWERKFFAEPGLHNLTDLRAFTNYSLSIKASSFYQQKLMLPEMIYPEFSVLTEEGIPSQPINFTVMAASPSEILVTWKEPEFVNAERVMYELFWQLGNSSLSTRKVVDGFEVSLVNLEPEQEYTIWLEVSSKPSKLNRTEKITITTYPHPQHLILVDSQAYNLTLHWPQSYNEFDSVVLECIPHSQDVEDSPFSIDITGIESNITVTNLHPKIKYEFYLKLQYPGIGHAYTWPEQQSAHYIFETLGDVPGRPGQPQIEHITGEIFKVSWLPAENNGAAIVEYSLEALQARLTKRFKRNAGAAESPSSNRTSSISILSQLPWVEELQPLEDKWLIYCNTSELSCIVRDLHTMRLLMFRVRARNDPYGWGPYSDDSVRVLEPFVSPQKRNSLVLAILAPAGIVATCVILLFVVRKVHQRRLKAKQLLAKSRPSIWSNVSSMQQQMASRHRAFSINSSATMYTGGPLSDADIALLPHINWSQISLLNFLGSGAFGEVYEGLIKHDDEEEPEKVAIKSLRKGASEFAELLKEAQLMSNFKHENIVRLIGVCCETESISIIMEHMEGGDLLSYLRESRPNSTRPLPSLQLLDLITMCIDVATGMAYLEDMHFVHRDLACRNCLVSSRIPSKRTVKIGDFGLARDIYKSDYYRKEGEALMPVRWMAPESLVDGVFTTQSDVWAFGVLCWEILTLGQQPYAARNNFEVLNFVKDGGRLHQPDNCPDKFFALMSDCWQTDADERPSFRRIFNTLLAIKTDVRRVSLGDYALYANQYGTVLSSFMPTPLKKVEEKDEGIDAQSDCSYESKENEKNEDEDKLHANIEKIDLKVRFVDKGTTSENNDAETTNDDESHLIDTKLYRTQENPDYYINEGISRL